MNTIRAAQAGQGGLVTIACINKATVGLGVDFDKLTTALQACYDEYFMPVWGYPVKLYNTATAKPSEWQLIYFDNADQAGALGYHALTKDGQPVSKIFVKTTLADNEQVSVTACHELFEMAIDPVANLWAEAADGTEYAYEMSDPVEEDTFLVDGDRDVELSPPGLVRTFQTSARHEIRSSRPVEDAVYDDQGRLHDHHEERQGLADLRLKSQREAFRERGPQRPPQRIPKGRQGTARRTGESEPPEAPATAKGRRAAS